jgi:hypothetical protein
MPPPPSAPIPLTIAPANSGAGALVAAGTQYTGAYVEPPPYKINSTSRETPIDIGSVPVLNAAGGLEKISVSNRNTLNNVEVFSDGGISIGRWTDGVGSGGHYPVDYNISANQGLHYAIGSTISILPISGGRADYKLSAADRPTYDDGHTAPGMLTNASLSIIFGAAPRIGFEASVVFPDANYTLSTKGGIADLGLAVPTNTLNNHTRILGIGNFTAYIGVCKETICGSTNSSGDILGAFSADLTRTALVYRSDYGFAGSAAFYLSGATNLSTTEPAGAPSGSSSASGLTNGTNGSASIALFSDNGIAQGGAAFPAILQSYDSTGALLAIAPSTVAGATVYARGTAVTVDQQSGPGWEVGRWTNGSVLSADAKYGGLGTALYGAGSGFHYVSFTKATGTLPTGIISYVLGGATTPTYADGRITSAGAFTGKLAIDASTTSLKAGLEGQIDTTDPLGVNKFTFATSGGVAAPSAAIIGTTVLLGSGLPVTATGHDCVGTVQCSFSFSLVNGGNAGALAAITYYLSDFVVGKQSLEGAALFTKSGFVAAPPPPPPAPGTVATMIPASGLAALTGQLFATIGDQGQKFGTTNLTAADNGYLAQYATIGLLSSAPTKLGTNRNYGSGSVAGVLGWTRWAGGTTDGFDGAAGGSTLPANGGNVYVWGSPATAVPTAGTATYTLLGGTAAIESTGAFTPGTLDSATLAVRFETRTVGLTAGFTINGASYAASSTGGLSSPSLALNTDNSFGIGGVVTGGGCTGVNASSCTASGDGFLSGAQAADAGISYDFRIVNTAANRIVDIIGTAGFATTGPTATPPFAATRTGQDFATGGGLIGSTVTAYDDGRLDSYVATVGQSAVQRGTNSDHENGGVAGIMGWTRWAGGTTAGGRSTAIPANGGYGVIWGTPATAFPTQGSASYAMIGSTAPVATDGSVAPGTVSAAALAVSFIDQKVGTTATILVDGKSYALTSIGGLSAPSLGLSGTNFGGTGNISGGLCTVGTTCGVDLTGFLAGIGASNAGLAYTFLNAPLGNSAASANFTGTIAFSRTTALPPLSVVLHNQIVRTLGFADLTTNGATVTTAADGKLESINSSSRGTATDHETGSVAGVIGWTRWADGTTTGNQTYVLPVNGGGSVIWGSPATAVPTSGTANYTMIGSTAPTNNTSTAPGTVRSAAMAVSFTDRKVGITTTVGFAGNDYILASAGGLTAPSIILDSSNSFITAAGTVSGGTCTSACTSKFSGFLAGAGASHAGAAYVFNNTPTGPLSVNGTIAFAKAP